MKCLCNSIDHKRFQQYIEKAKEILSNINRGTSMLTIGYPNCQEHKVEARSTRE